MGGAVASELQRHPEPPATAGSVRLEMRQRASAVAWRARGRGRDHSACGGGYCTNAVGMKRLVHAFGHKGDEKGEARGFRVEWGQERRLGSDSLAAPGGSLLKGAKLLA